jgi:hypothetical protein
MQAGRTRMLRMAGVGVAEALLRNHTAAGVHRRLADGGATRMAPGGDGVRALRVHAAGAVVAAGADGAAEVVVAVVLAAGDREGF